MKYRVAALLLSVLLLTACGEEQTELTGAARSASGDENALFANDACSYVLEGTSQRGDEYVWQVRLSNATASELVFSMDHVYIDDCLADPYFAVAVAAGESSEVEVVWTASEQSVWSPDRVGRVDFLLSVYPRGAADAPTAQAALTAYPRGENAYQTAERQPLPTDRTLLETEDCAVVLTEWIQEDARCGMRLFAENRSDRTVTYTLEDLRLNGQSFETMRLLALDGGKRGPAEVCWQLSELAEYEISTLGEITFDLTVRDASDNSVLYSEHLSVRP